MPGHPLLEASSWGRIRSAPYQTRMPHGGTKTNRMAPTYGVWVRSGRDASHKRRKIMFRRKDLKVARLVCLAFHGRPPKGKPYALHRDEDSGNNTPGNLFWGTQKENLNAPGFIAYCRARTGENSPITKHQRRKEAERDQRNRQAQ